MLIPPTSLCALREWRIMRVEGDRMSVCGQKSCQKMGSKNPAVDAVLGEWWARLSQPSMRGCLCGLLWLIGAIWCCVVMEDCLSNQRESLMPARDRNGQYLAEM